MAFSVSESDSFIFTVSAQKARVASINLQPLQKRNPLMRAFSEIFCSEVCFLHTCYKFLEKKFTWQSFLHIWRGSSGIFLFFCYFKVFYLAIFELKKAIDTIGIFETI